MVFAVAELLVSHSYLDLLLVTWFDNLCCRPVVGSADIAKPSWKSRGI